MLISALKKEKKEALEAVISLHNQSLKAFREDLNMQARCSKSRRGKRRKTLGRVVEPALPAYTHSAFCVFGAPHSSLTAEVTLLTATRSYHPPTLLWAP